MVEPQPSKLLTRVRFPLSAPVLPGNDRLILAGNLMATYSSWLPLLIMRSEAQRPRGSPEFLVNKVSAIDLFATTPPEIAGKCRGK